MERLARGSRVFIDSSVLFAGCRSERGFARDLLNRGGDGRDELWASRYVIEETRQNLSRKSRTADVTFLDRLVARRAVRVAMPSLALVEHVAGSIEPKDAPIVAAAITAEASMLATYDRRHLLSQADLIRATFGVEVLTPDEVLRRLADADARPTP